MINIADDSRLAGTCEMMKNFPLLSKMRLISSALLTSLYSHFPHLRNFLHIEKPAIRFLGWKRLRKPVPDLFRALI